ncbi:hypothetical protein F5X96DRAFT_266315 [Biscogniauxia mediterranea]|nr:hypothetical protein F5X96DRAFT_266315 [Biscogniauxia mediterranea]
MVMRGRKRWWDPAGETRPIGERSVLSFEGAGGAPSHSDGKAERTYRYPHRYSWLAARRLFLVYVLGIFPRRKKERKGGGLVYICVCVLDRGYRKGEKKYGDTAVFDRALYYTRVWLEVVTGVHAVWPRRCSFGFGLKKREKLKKKNKDKGEEEEEKKRKRKGKTRKKKRKLQI